MSSLVEIHPIPYHLIPDMWKTSKPMIERSVRETDGEYSIAHIYTSLLEKKRNLWVVFKNGLPIASITTRIDEYPTGLRVGVIDYAGGESFEDWDMFSEYVSDFFRLQGCKKIEIAGRAGWERLHTAKGFKRKYTVLRKDLASE